jgi:predicted DsbA family dithiol-disulfide isomerase
MAFESPKISASVVDATEFPDLVRRYRINGVPKTVVNDRVEILGAQPEEIFVGQVLSVSTV